MRLPPLSSRTGLLPVALLAFVLATAPHAEAAAGAAVASASPAAKTGIAPRIAPHRAIYNMELASVKNGSSITGVSGRMLFEWADMCDGWAVEQNLKLHFDYAQGDESDVNSSTVSWESKDGKQYDFYVRRVSDGKVTDIYRGKATMGPDGGEVVYSIPAKKIVKLAPGTIFPSQHTALLIQEALAGKKMLLRRVFDGSDDEGMDDISAFIGPEEAHLEATEMNPKLKDSTLLQQPAWPIQMAFFKLKTDTGLPDYEMNLVLLANGVARRMMLDYGDFSVSGVLSSIEAVPAPASCRG